MVLGTVIVAGASLTRKRCAACNLAFVQAPNEERSKCVDCDPPEDAFDLGIGRDNSGQRHSEKNYHGGGYRE